MLTTILCAPARCASGAPAAMHPSDTTHALVTRPHRDWRVPPPAVARDLAGSHREVASRLHEPPYGHLHTISTHTHDAERIVHTSQGDRRGTPVGGCDVRPRGGPRWTASPHAHRVGSLPRPRLIRAIDSLRRRSHLCHPTGCRTRGLERSRRTKERCRVGIDSRSTHDPTPAA